METLEILKIVENLRKEVKEDFKNELYQIKADIKAIREEFHEHLDRIDDKLQKVSDDLASFKTQVIDMSYETQQFSTKTLTKEEHKEFEKELARIKSEIIKFKSMVKVIGLIITGIVSVILPIVYYLKTEHIHIK
ncbi:MAG: hypothetical protein N3A54_00465 [Patescibacteria group bacterium]|nr:hypothetical protein [Patescibacteria group bacterium]